MKNQNRPTGYRHRRPWPGENGTFGQHLAYLRSRTGVSQDVLAEKAGWHNDNHQGAKLIQRIEGSVQIPRLDQLQDLAHAFNLTTSELIERTWANQNRAEPRGHHQ